MVSPPDDILWVKYNVVNGKRAKHHKVAILNWFTGCKMKLFKHGPKISSQFKRRVMWRSSSEETSPGIQLYPPSISLNHKFSPNKAEIQRQEKCKRIILILLKTLRIKSQALDEMHHNPFITLVLESRTEAALVKQPCYIETEKRTWNPMGAWEACFVYLENVHVLALYILMAES